jgi:hypothetical protein
MRQMLPQCYPVDIFDFRVELQVIDFIGGAGEDRTRDLLTASSVLPLKTQDLCVFL